MIEHNPNYWEDQLAAGIERSKQEMLDRRTLQIVEYLRRSPSMSGAAQRIEEVFIGKPLDPPPDGVEDGA